jgi:hypothetical protein
MLDCLIEVHWLYCIRSISDRDFVFPILCDVAQVRQSKVLAKFGYKQEMKTNYFQRILYIFGYILEPNREIWRYFKKKLSKFHVHNLTYTSSLFVRFL